MGHALPKHPGHAPAEARGAPHRPARRWGRLLTVVCLAAVLGLLAWAATKVDWQEVWVSLRRIPAASLLAALGAAVVSHLIYSTYDLMGRTWTGHRLRRKRVMQTTFVCYAFNLNLGSLIGGFAFRYRLYSRLGLRKSVITQILALSLTTNWLGYAALAGGVFLFRWLTPPPGWTIGAAALPWVGALLWAGVAAYLWLCGFSRKRHFTVRGHHVHLPSGRMAALQLFASALNWMIIGSVVWLLLGDAVPYPKVLAALLTAAMAGVLTHVPAGVGVLEAVFVALLTPEVPAATLLAALLAYRAIYYLLPLAIATALYFFLEAKAGKERARLAEAEHGAHRPPHPSQRHHTGR